MNDDWFAAPADRPLGRMADMVGAIRAYLTAPNMKPVRHDGEFYPLDAPTWPRCSGRIDVPILLGAFNEGMLQRRRTRRRRRDRPRAVHRPLVGRDDRPEPRRRRGGRRPRPGGAAPVGMGDHGGRTTTTRRAPSATPD